MGQQVLPTLWYFCTTLDPITTENITILIFFYVLLTVHLSTILTINQLNAQILVLL